MLIGLIPVQYAAFRSMGEPYPALFQPAFLGVPESGGIAYVDEMTVIAWAQSDRYVIDPASLLPGEPDVLAASVFSTVMRSLDGDRAVEASRWVHDRLVAIVGGPVTALELIVTRVGYRVGTMEAVSSEALSTRLHEFGDH